MPGSLRLCGALAVYAAASALALTGDEPAAAPPSTVVSLTPAQAATGTNPPPPPAYVHPVAIVSPEVRPDGRVTFRFPDQGARQVLLLREAAPGPVPMVRNPYGVWEVTVGPLEPDFYGYSFIADGVSLVDPDNSLLKPNLLFQNSMVHVPGPASLTWEMNDVPHGEIRRHLYQSAILGAQSDYYVYTPPGYDRREARTYPVLYLLHGYSDDARSWTEVGRANVILDNLIARRQARPMIVVMPLGYGVPAIVARNSGVSWNDLAARARSYDLFRQILLTEVLPEVETDYAIAPGPQNRAIAGLSMGGEQALLIGLNDPDQFAWIGSFSAGAEPEDDATAFPGVNGSVNSRLRLLYIACGVDDLLLAPNRGIRAWLSSRGVTHQDIETAGAHCWPVWRRNLTAFVPQLFTP